MTAKVDPGETTRFLEVYAEALAEGLGQMVLFTLPNRQSFASREVASLAQYAARQAQAGLDVYFHVHLHDLPEGESFRRGRIETARAAIGVFCDLDACGPGRRKPAETLCPTVADSLLVIDEFNERYKPLQVSLVIGSGYGCYPTILLKEPLVFEQPQDKALLESLGRRFHAALHRIASRRGWSGAADFCDLAKVLRLPGSVNWKDASSPKPVRLLSEEPARFTLGDLDDLLPHREDEPEASTGFDPDTVVISINPDPKGDVPDALLDALVAEDPKFAATWNHQRGDLRDQSCSGYDMALAGIGVDRGLTDQQIAGLLTLHRTRFPGKKQERVGPAYQKYLQRTIAKARQGGPSSEEAEQQWAEIRQQVEALPPDSAPDQARQDEGQPKPKQRSGTLATEGGTANSAAPTDSVNGDGAAKEPESQERGHRHGMPASVEFLVAKIEATQDFVLPYQHISLLAALSEAELACAYQRLKAALGSKLDRSHFETSIKEARLGLQAKAPKTPAAPSTATEPRHPYREWGIGIVRVKDSKNGTEEAIALTNFTARITADIGEDDGIEVKRFFGIEAKLMDKPYSFIVPANKFASMEWAIESIGPNAVVHPNQKDWARAAIQSLSTDIHNRRIYVHTGWRRVGDSMLYLHGGGAIGAGGTVPEVDVRLSGALVHYDVVLPESREQLVEAVRASLHVLGVAPDHISFALLAAAYRACIRSCDFSVWFGGPTGVFKSELAALAQQHYGAAMNARRLPGNFASTGNSLETLAFITKDALLVIDDFAPHGGTQDIARYHAAADRILRAAGNNQGRGRLSSDARLREAKPPRGLILATGEDMPRGQSIRGRTLIVEVAPGDVRTDILTECQVAAANGVYATTMGGFVNWLAGQYDKVQADFQARVLELRSQATRAHSRTPGIVADLYAGFELFLEFASSVEAITVADKQALGERCWAALNRVAKAQRVQQDASEPTQRFLELLRAAILSGEAHVAGLDGGAPGDEGQWGWQLVGSGDHQRLVSRGKCIGWLDGGNLYLEPTASFGMAQELGRSTGEPLVVGQITLNKRLKEKGLLASTDVTRGTLTVRRRVCGESVPVIHLRADALAAEPVRPDQYGIAATGHSEVFEC